MKKTSVIILLISLTLLFLTGCALFTSKESPLNDPRALYQRGYDDYQKGRYEKAIDNFQTLKEKYPLDDLVVRAELGIADSHFSMEEYARAEGDYSAFISIHPASEYIPYVMYQIGMCHYKQLSSIDRDQTETWNALKEFEKLLYRFPTSRFSYLAEKKARECKSRIAEHEFYVGELYFKMKQYKAALARFETITRDYANLGLDYKVNFLLEETKKRLEESTKQVSRK